MKIPCVEISDSPNYPWRGMMLDVSRYFFDKDFMLHYLDMMAMHKMNMLHWHIIDDSGWRIEIKKYPKLTSIGAFRGEGVNRNGGYYTQEEIKEIVNYATERNITIVPEIELPAHTLAAIVAYPHLGCTGQQHVVPNRHFISRDLYCAGKATTWEFLEDVMDEVVELFPSEFIHIGGDEAKYDRWKKCKKCQQLIKDEGLKNEHELQGYMTRRIEKYLKKYNRRIIGWDEILATGVTNRAGIMTWHRPATAVQGAKRGNPVVMSLTGHTYFDAPESKLPGELPGATWIAPISLEKAYNWEPRPKGLSDAEAKNILGASGCIWTDQFLHKPFLADMPAMNERRSELYVEYFSLPRMAALAEVTWTAKPNRDWKDFSQRMARQYVRYTNAGYNYRVPVPEVTAQKTAGGFSLTAANPIEGGTVRYTTDGSYPNIYSAVYDSPVTIKDKKSFKAIAVAPDGKHHSLDFEFRGTDPKFKSYGAKLGQWKSGQAGSGKAKTITYDATGLIDKNGTYLITFIYTGGEFRLDIDGIAVYKNQRKIAEDRHHGFTGGQKRKNTYTFKIDEYETGAEFKIKADIYGDEGDDSKGLIFIKRK